MVVGAQFYTIREFCKDLDNLAESLKKVADIGYTTVQLSGTCPYDPAWMKEQLDKNGLKCVITHNASDALSNEPERLVKDHDILDCKYIGLGGHKIKDEDGMRYDDFFTKYLESAKYFKENGKYFMYHNHAHEFRKMDGKLILDKLAEDMPKDLMGFTLDTYWVQVGGGDPAAWIEKLSGRVPVIHLKDFSYDTEPMMAVVGEGNINFDRVFEKAEAAGTKYMMVEQDKCYGEDPFDCLRRSYNNLKAFGFR